MGEAWETSYNSDVLKEVEKRQGRSRKENAFSDFSYFNYAITQKLGRRCITADSNPDQSMQNWWGTKRHLDKLVSDYFSFVLSL
jgi:hypothetical protein